jgi:Na+/H+-dicarboxylate symporter
VLGLIVMSLLFGVTLSKLGAPGRPLAQVIDVANDALLKLVGWIVWLAPAGILGLVADRLGRAGGGAAVWDDLNRLGWYALTVMIGLLVHAGLTLPLILRLLAGRNPVRYGSNMGDAVLVAMGTASSAATMPVTLRCVTEKNGVSERAADFVIPVGSTIKMDGTALYEAVAVIFIAQTLGIELTMGQQVIVALTATLAAIGAAAIPEAGLVTMVLVLGAVGLPAEGVGLILSIDWVLDRFRTSVNVWGDAVGAATVDRMLSKSAAG